ncbi:MAG: hypothetical protein RRC07_06005 [Anaerolineae bacterium]|nr:hypothetical protein [Anaerolineae bacterium]
MNRTIRLLAPLLLILAATLACAIPGFDSDPTPPPDPTPPGDMIFFTAPFRAPLHAGTYIPGTQIGYLQSSGEVHELLIDGLRAYRQVGDSITWRGIVAPGVQGTYQLRLQSSFRGELSAEGQVQLVVLNPIPVEIPPTQTPAGTIYFSGIPVTYVVPEGANIPGTSLVYEGQRNGVAELSGTAGYPFFSVEDSLLWLGKLRQDVTVRYNMRVNRLDQYGLHLGGTAELWVVK